MEFNDEIQVTTESGNTYDVVVSAVWNDELGCVEILHFSAEGEYSDVLCMEDDEYGEVADLVENYPYEVEEHCADFEAYYDFV